VLTRRPWTLRHHARLLADLHALVHAVPVLGWLRAPFGTGPALLHPHPANVILAADGPCLIDWQGAARHRLKDPSVHAAEAVRIRRLLRSARLADRPRG
jgi:hypothetical protein